MTCDPQTHQHISPENQHFLPYNDVTVTLEKMNIDTMLPNTQCLRELSGKRPAMQQEKQRHHGWAWSGQPSDA